MKNLLTEYFQFDDKNIFDPQRTDSLNYEEKQYVLYLIIMLQEKRCGTLKARTCSDDRKQWVYLTKDEMGSPTLQLNSLLMSLIIDAQEKRDVATANVLGAYLMVDVIIMCSQN